MLRSCMHCERTFTHPLTHIFACRCWRTQLSNLIALFWKSAQAKTAGEKKVTTARMSVATRALCFAMRNPPKGLKKYKLSDIQKMISKKDGTRPSLGAISGAGLTFMDPKSDQRRPVGSRKTTTAEDKELFKTFHKVRPPGCGVDSRSLHGALPKKVSKKMSRRTVIRRLAEKGYKPNRKIQKSDPGPALQKKRLVFVRKYKDRTANQWKGKLQGVSDYKEFTFYPQGLRSRFKRFRATWTYMTKKEKKTPPFARPKRWFPKKDWKKVKKFKVFGMCTSNGKSLAFPVPYPNTGEQWASDIKTHVAPFLKKSFPNLSSYEILLDGEPLLHCPEAKAMLKKYNITVLQGWPKYSPDMNPQENVWAWAEPALRKLEKPQDTFAKFQKKVLKAVRAYPSAGKLVPAMAKRCKLVEESLGGMIAT